MEFEPLGRLLIAAVLAGVIGLDRELRAKPAGLRTNIVVGVAAAAFAYLGAEAFGGGDPTRVASQVVSGIGFLGGGAIFAAGAKPHGVTTAAALWGSAAIGIAAGVGEVAIAVAIVVVTLAALWPVDRLAAVAMDRFGRHDLHVHVVAESRDALADVNRLMVERDLHVLESDLRPGGDAWVLELTIGSRLEDLRSVADGLTRLPGVLVIADGPVRAGRR